MMNRIAINPNRGSSLSGALFTSTSGKAEAENNNDNRTNTEIKHDSISVFGLENYDINVSESQKHTMSNVSETNYYTKVAVKHDLYSILSAFFENEVFETGIINASEKYFLNELQKDIVSALNTLHLLFWDNFCSNGRKINNLIGILHTISHIDYLSIYPLGVAMAVSALNHKNQEVAEFGIKCFENWNHPDGIQKLNNVNYASEWLRDYANSVIEDLQD